MKYVREWEEPVGKVFIFQVERKHLPGGFFFKIMMPASDFAR